MQAIVSESPQMEMAFRMASSKESDSKKAASACGTEPWQVVSKWYVSRMASGTHEKSYRQTSVKRFRISSFETPVLAKNTAPATATAPFMPSSWPWVGKAVSLATSTVRSKVSNAQPTGPTLIAEPFQNDGWPQLYADLGGSLLLMAQLMNIGPYPLPGYLSAKSRYAPAKSEPSIKAFAVAKESTVSSVKNDFSANNANSLLLWLFHSYTEPTMSQTADQSMGRSWNY